MASVAPMIINMNHSHISPMMGGGGGGGIVGGMGASTSTRIVGVGTHMVASDGGSQFQAGSSGMMMVSHQGQGQGSLQQLSQQQNQSNQMTLSQTQPFGGIQTGASSASTAVALLANSSSVPMEEDDETPLTSTELKFLSELDRY